MSKPKPSTLTILFIVVVAALLGLQVSEQAHGQQWKIAFESGRDGDTDIYLVNPDGSDLQRLTMMWSTKSGHRVKAVKRRSML